MSLIRAAAEHIIVYGQSLGSGPTLHLAVQHRVRGVVLHRSRSAAPRAVPRPHRGAPFVHSAIMSGLRVIREQASTRFFDIFPNIDLVCGGAAACAVPTSSVCTCVRSHRCAR